MIRQLTCPVCDQNLPLEITGESSLFPFCSLRCKQIDLHRWFSGEYAITEEITPDKLFEHMAQRELPPEE